MSYGQECFDWKCKKDEARNNLSPDEYKDWLKNNPEPVLSEQEHREKLNICLKEAKEFNDNRSKVYCPIEHGFCNIKCESYTMATVHNTIHEEDMEDGGWCVPYMTEGRCTAFILKGKL